MQSDADETSIRCLVDDWATAIREKNARRALAHFAPDSVRFYLNPPLQAVMPDQDLELWFDSFEGPIRYEVRGLNVSTSEHLAFCHSFNHIVGDRANGSRMDLWIRETLCLRKINCRWKISHAHESVPLYTQPPFLAALGDEAPVYAPVGATA